MRMIVIKQATDLKMLGALLLGDKAGTSKTLERLQQLNPHINFSRIGVGSVLLVPESPDLKAGETLSIAGEAFNGFVDQAMAGFGAAATRMLAGHEKRLADQKEVTAVFRLAAVKRAMDGDADLRAQIDNAAEVFKQDQVLAKAADETVGMLKDAMSAEFAALNKLLAG